MSAFSDEASRDPRFVAARERVKLTLDESRPNVRGFGSQAVTVVPSDGRTLSKVVELSSIKGRDTAPVTVGHGWRCSATPSRAGWRRTRCSA
jgi:hypothetical protein